MVIVGGAEYHRACNPNKVESKVTVVPKETETCAQCQAKIGPLDEKVVVAGVAYHRGCSPDASSSVIGEQKPEGGVDTDMSHLYSNQRKGDEPLW